MADRTGSPDFDTWVKSVEDRLAALQRGDTFSGTVSVGRLLIGNMYVDDVRDVKQSVDKSEAPGVLLTDKNTGVECFIPAPCFDIDNGSEGSAPELTFHWPTSAGALTTGVSDLRTVRWPSSVVACTIDVATGLGFTLQVRKNGTLIPGLSCIVTAAGTGQRFLCSPCTVIPYVDTIDVNVTSVSGGCSGTHGVFVHVELLT